jgi:hypothetical protein
MSIRDFRGKVNVDKLRVGDYVEIRVKTVSDIFEVIRETATKFVLKNKLYISKNTGRLTESGYNKIKGYCDIQKIRYRIVSKEEFTKKQQDIEKKQILKKIKPNLKHLSYDEVLEIYSKIIDKVGVI